MDENGLTADRKNCQNDLKWMKLLLGSCSCGIPKPHSFVVNPDANDRQKLFEEEI